jgi:urea-proton symporter
MAAIRKGDDHELAEAAHIDLELIAGEATVSAEQLAIEKAKLDRASVIAKSTTVFLTLSLLLLWPIPMYGSGYIFSKPFFTGWVAIGIMWLFCSLLCVGVFPLWEGRVAIVSTTKSIFLDIIGRRRPRQYHTHQGAEVTEAAEKSDGLDTPPPTIGAGENAKGLEG